MKNVFFILIIASTALAGSSIWATEMTLTLQLRGRVPMEQLAENVSNPQSNHYGRYYEPSEIRALAGPSDAEYQQLLAGLKLEGLVITSESPTHLWITVRGEQAIFESLFSTEVQSLGQGVHQQIRPLFVPIHLDLIEAVSGLDNTRKSHPKYKMTPLRSQDLGYTPSEIKAAYGFKPLYASGLSGKNVNIAIATYDSFKIKNVNKYFTLQKILPKPTVSQVNFNGKARYNEQSAGETELDAEFSGMIAPGSHIYVYTAKENSDQGEVQLFTAILDQNLAKIVNYSWGGCETNLDPAHKVEMQKVLARAVAQGVNILVASGDDGSDDCQDKTVAADWPSSSPYVTAVGGTKLNYNGRTRHETGWSGSGGGVSKLWERPSWQIGLTSPYVRRSSPDVAFNADPDSGEAEYTTSSGYTGWAVVGGTSMAAPQWAGFLALVAEARAAEGRSELGFVTPLFYQMTDAQRAAAFHDITSGSNGHYKCTVGWDAVTGFGSMQADVLASYLKSL